MLLHLAMKAFYPGKPPFPLLHVDTTWKFREMIAFRDQRVRELGSTSSSTSTQDGIRQGIGPFSHGSALHTDVMKTQALRAGAGTSTASTPRSAARAATKRSRAPRNASFRSASATIAGIRRTSGRNSGACTTRCWPTGESMRVFPLSNWTELDIWEYILLENIPIVPLYFAAPAAGGRARRRADHGRRRPDAAAARRTAGWRGPVSHPGLLSR